jgi:hydroxymethylbilane synthase
LHPIVTRGDIEIDKPLPQIGGKGLFTSELEQALLSGRIDLAVHSAKDLPTENPPGLDILCVPPRGPVADVLVTPAGVTLRDLPPGARVGTSSLRRRLQLAALRPDLRFIGGSRARGGERQRAIAPAITMRGSRPRGDDVTWNA